MVIDQNLLVESLSYDRETGEFKWLVNRGSRARKGNVAGYLRADGYRIIRIDKFDFYAHRLAWWFVYGDMPDLIDHINRNPTDNKISNLREADSYINSRNSKTSKRNSSGYKGVSWSKGMKKWRMVFTHRGAQTIEYFDNLEEAGDRYKNLELQNA